MGQKKAGGSVGGGLRVNDYFGWSTAVMERGGGRGIQACRGQMRPAC